ncbi:MAG: methyltransferase domain-containing protein [Candidatus Omnitrophica bacterium]|jgi:protein-L-isoaspartate O-methyltransferase|nr:methyltransferase domain-containing protein [Candidatus Omnitrophota bacterium]
MLIPYFFIIHFGKPCLKTKLITGLFIAFLFLYFHTTLAQTGQEIASPFSSMLVERQKERVAFSSVKDLIDAIGLQPQMTVLDIGTGSGQFAFAFSNYMKGKGYIFATDIEKEKIEFIKRYIKNNNIKNIFPVLVRSKGVDPFYIKHQYDIIFLAHTKYYISNRVEYYQILRKQLTDNGIFVILGYKYCDNFSAIDITNPLGCDTILRSLPPSSPFHNYFYEEKTNPIKQSSSINNNGTQTKLAKTLNAMLNDLSFFSQFFDAQGKINTDLTLLPEEKQFLYWVFRFLKEDQILDNYNRPKLTTSKSYLKHRFLIRTINKILIVQQFRQFLYNGRAPYLPGAKLELQMEPEKNEMKQAGFRLKAEYDFIPFEILLIFDKIQQ